MAGYLKVDVERFPTQAINTQINSRILEEFQKKLKQQNIPMNVVLNVFLEQYANGNYHIDKDDIDKWRGDNGATSTLNTPVNKEIYLRFKDAVKSNGLFVKSVLSAFIEEYGSKDLVMEFVNREVTK